MIATATRAAFEAMTRRGGGDPGALAMGLRRQMTSVGLQAFAAKTLHAAIIAPERLSDVYENAAAGWLSRPVFAPRALRQAPAPVEPPQAFWNAFWPLVEMPLAERHPLAYAARTAHLAGLLPAKLNERVAAAALDYPGVASAAGGLPTPFSKGRLARCHPGTLGGQFYTRVLRRGGGLGVFDPVDLGLADLPPPLDYLNARILQCHDLWGLVAGYGEADLDEIALSAFQVGQFGHAFSALVLALVFAATAFHRDHGIPSVLDTVLLGWTHGRESPPLLGVDWESLWDLPPDAARERLGLTPRSPDYDPLRFTKPAFGAR